MTVNKKKDKASGEDTQRISELDARITQHQEFIMTLARQNAAQGKLLVDLADRMSQYHGEPIVNCRKCSRKINPMEKKCGVCGTPV